MPRSASISIPRNRQVCLVSQLERVPEEGARLLGSPSSLMGPYEPSQVAPREYDSWPCDSFILLPDSVLSMDAGAFRADLKALDPVLSASLPDWASVEDLSALGGMKERDTLKTNDRPRGAPPNSPDRRAYSLLHNHEGLTVTPFSKGTVLIGGGIENTRNSDTQSATSVNVDGPLNQNSTQSVDATATSAHDPASSVNSKLTGVVETKCSSASLPAAGVTTKPEGTARERLGFKDREDRVRQLRDRQQQERIQKLEELKEHALAAQKFREQQEQLRRQRLEEMRARDNDRRSQVEERKRLIEQAERERRESVLRKAQEREQRLEHKRRQERSNAVFAFGSSTPRMLDPKESKAYWTQRRATSTSNVNVTDGSGGLQILGDANREVVNSDFAKKRATSAHSLHRKGDELRMSTSMYEVFNWDEGGPSSSLNQGRSSQVSPTQGKQGMRLTKSRDSSVERRTRDYRRASPDRSRWTQSSTTPPSLSSSPPPAFPSDQPYSTSSRASSTSKPSRFSLWEFGDNFTALGPSSSENQQKHPSPEIPSFSTKVHSSAHALTAPVTPTYAGSRHHHFLGPDICAGGEDLMTQSMTSYSSAARRRTDLVPAVPGFRPISSRTPGGSPRHKSPGVRSGTTTPSSRPNSALSQSSTNQVTMRNKTTPRKPRPLSIAGTAPTKAEKRPLSIAGTTPDQANRESRSVERKATAPAPTPPKTTRAKSATNTETPTGSTTPSKSRPSTARRTPAQVKAESAAKKAALAARIKSPPTKTTPAAEKPAVKDKKTKATEKPVPEVKVKAEDSVTKETSKSVEEQKTKQQTEKADSKEEIVVNISQESEDVISVEVSEVKQEFVQHEVKEESVEKEIKEETVKVDIEGEIQRESVQVVVKEETVTTSREDKQISEESVTVKTEESVKEDKVESETSETIADDTPAAPKLAQEKPVTGYASEEEYKAALAEKRRQAREAKEREQELERQKQLEEEERQRKEEEEYLKMLEEQKNAEEERLRKAIEEAEVARQEEMKRKEEEEKQRIENERIEAEKRRETEERLKKEEEERQMRKSRVAAIMSRTRGTSKSKNEAKTPTSEDKPFAADQMVSSTIADAIASTMTSSMTDSMIVKAIESHEQEDTSSEKTCVVSGMIEKTDAEQVQSLASSQATSGVCSTDPFEISSQPQSTEFSSQATSDFFQSDPSLDPSVRSIKVTETSVDNLIATETVTGSEKVDGAYIDNVRKEEVGSGPVDNLLGEDVTVELASLRLDNPPAVHMNGNGTVNGTHSVDLLESFKTVGLNHQDEQRNSPEFSQFDQIIDLSQTKLSNEDAVNSNTSFPQPIIAFEENINITRKSSSTSQSQESSPSVPDLLL